MLKEVYKEKVDIPDYVWNAYKELVKGTMIKIY